MGIKNPIRRHRVEPDRPPERYKPPVKEPAPATPAQPAEPQKVPA